MIWKKALGVSIKIRAASADKEDAVTHVCNKIVTFKGGQLTWFNHKELLFKVRIYCPLGANSFL